MNLNCSGFEVEWEMLFVLNSREWSIIVLYLGIVICMHELFGDL